MDIERKLVVQGVLESCRKIIVRSDEDSIDSAIDYANKCEDFRKEFQKTYDQLLQEYEELCSKERFTLRDLKYLSELEEVLSEYRRYVNSMLDAVSNLHDKILRSIPKINKERYIVETKKYCIHIIASNNRDGRSIFKIERKQG